ncbi:MAG: hypothetical protein R3C03_02700 [Pirellulaceae bacterium]
MNDLFGVEFGWLQWVLLAVIGIVVGIINTLAGSGSLITLPIFMFFFHLPAPVANGTNRIGVVAKCLGSLRVS